MFLYGSDKVRRRFTLTLTILVILGVASGYIWFDWIAPKMGIQTAFNGTGDDEGINKRVSVLLIGADQRDPKEEKFNTDSIILATVDPQEARISLLSIPRDTRVSIPGHSNIKINSVAPLTEMKKLQDVVSDLTGVKVSGYIQTNFEGFKDIIDTLGGITIDVEKDMYYETGDTTDGYINLKKGLQKLDGSKALQYARFRHDALADISRTARQQVVLKAVAKEMMQVSTIPKLPWLIPQLTKAVHTNLQAADIFKLAKAAVQFDDAEIVSQTLPGRFMDVDGISYWDVDTTQARDVVADLMKGITTDKIIEDQEVDLLKPIITNPATLPRVPGNPVDPNGRKSSGYQEFDLTDELEIDEADRDEINSDKAESVNNEEARR
jgi:LCP family protein required for cell wall assembly